MGNQNNNLAFLDLVLKTMNIRHNLSLEYDFSIRNNKNEQIFFDLVDTSKSAFIILIEDALVEERSKVVKQINNITNSIIESRQLSSNKFNLHIIFKNTISQTERQFYSKKFPSSSKFYYEILDRNDILGFGETFNIDTSFFNNSQKNNIIENLLKNNIEANTSKVWLTGYFEESDDSLIEFISESFWINKKFPIDTEAINSAELGDLILIKKAYNKDNQISLKLIALGVIYHNFQDGKELLVNWTLFGDFIAINDTQKLYINNFEAISPEDWGKIYPELITQMPDLPESILNLRSTPSLVLLGKLQNIKSPTKINNATLNIAKLLCDDTKGQDHLEISRDVSAFAKIIASKAFTPPLSIALFGQWGAGKSFFMNKLSESIDVLSKSNFNLQNQIFCKGIVQIHFNAWSYLDSNLWASIVTRIFEGLNEYIGNDSKAKVHKKEIEKQLKETLFVIKEERESLENQKKSNEIIINDLIKKRTSEQKSLNDEIEKIRNKTLKKILIEVDDEFDVSKKITSAFGDNPVIIEIRKELDEVLPEECKNNPELLIKELNSTRTSISLLLKSEKIYLFIGIVLVILLAINIVPLILRETTDYLKNNFIVLPQLFLSLVVIITPIWKAYRKTYEKIKPLINKIWKIKIDYDKAIEDAVYSNKQQIEASKIVIENKKTEILIYNTKIDDLTSKIKQLDFKLENSLSTESLFSFINSRSVSDEYQKHLGIISIIRKDFQILNKLLDESIIEQESVDFRYYFKNPLQRIVLYIDDLDRCDEDRVIEVLEAVNLLMAFPLFVVVVGVDDRWVNNALIKKYHLQFSGKINENDNSHQLIPINASDYLEKIFQVPFHLKNASDNEVKTMLFNLTKNSIKADKDNSEAEEDTEKSKSNINPKPIQFSNLQLGEATFEDEYPTIEKIEAENSYFVISAKEIELIQAFSGIIGSNPRSIKRFVNIYQIVMAHEDQNIKNNESELIAIMFLLALSLGKNKNIYSLFIEYISRNENKSSQFHNIISKISSKNDQPKFILALSFLLNLAEYISDKKILNDMQFISVASLINHNNFISRFTFNHIEN